MADERCDKCGGKAVWNWHGTELRCVDECENKPGSLDLGDDSIYVDDIVFNYSGSMFFWRTAEFVRHS